MGRREDGHQSLSSPSQQLQGSRKLDHEVRRGHCCLRHPRPSLCRIFPPRGCCRTAELFGNCIFVPVTSQIIGDALKRIYRECVIGPLVRMLLVIMGLWSIQISYGKSQQLRIRLSVNPSTISLSDIQNDDIIISNFTGYVQVLVYSTLSLLLRRFTCRISDRFGFVNANVGRGKTA